MYRGQQDSMYVDDVELITPPTTFGFLSQEFPAPPVGELIENFEDSTGNSSSNSKWLVVKKEWGNGNVAYNNGVVPENLELLCDGGMRFHGHGDLYNGPINGVANIIGNGKIRVGACIATKDYYASGRYEVVAKVTPGMINAFWTFHYIEDPNFQNGGMKNSEIDWEFPSNLYTGNKHTITDGLCNTWGGLCDGVGLTTSGISYKENLNVVDASQDFHTYTIEWHTGDSNIAPSISWYFDSVLVKQETNTTYIPFRASRFWIGVWYGNTNWITGGDMSVLQYADKYMDVRSVKIKPFYEANDIYENETVPALGFVGPNFYPTYPCNSNNQLVRTKQQSANSNSISPSNLSNEITLFPTPTKAEINLSVSELVPDIITDITILDL